jgi:hypothetical protein
LYSDADNINHETKSAIKTNLGAAGGKAGIFTTKRLAGGCTIPNIELSGRFLSKFFIVWCVLIYVKHYKLIASKTSGIMTAKKETSVQKLVASKKTAEELANEEYQTQLELAIENH